MKTIPVKISTLYSSLLAEGKSERNKSTWLLYQSQLSIGIGSYQTIWCPPLPNVTRHSGWWPHTVTPSIDRTLHQFLTITDLDLITELTFYLIVQGFHRTYATGAACQQRTLTPPDTWSCPTLGLACVLMSRPISPELVLSPDFWISNTPRYFSFAFDPPFWLLFCFLIISIVFLRI